MPSADTRSAALFADVFGGEPSGTVRSPGRVNLMGDHTDYNDGFVLPVAIDRDTHVTFRWRSDTEVHLVSEDGGSARFDLTTVSHGEPAWAEYVRGVAWAMNATGPGWEAAIATDVPIGAGLSSSASLEIAVGMLLDHGPDAPLSRTDLALAAQKAENDWVGMSCGIMDQLSVAAARSGHAMLLDCRDLSIEHIQVPHDLAFVVLDTGTRRQLTDSAYNERRETCERAARELGVASLRDVSLDQLPSALEQLDRTAAKRVRHVVTENARVLAMAEALRTDDRQTVGRVMLASHESLRDDFESSTPELDTMVGIAAAIGGCHGARVTGAGFGGAAVASVDRDGVDAFVPRVVLEYHEATGIEPSAHVCIPSERAEIS